MADEKVKHAIFNTMQVDVYDLLQNMMFKRRLDPSPGDSTQSGNTPVSQPLLFFLLFRYLATFLHCMTPQKLHPKKSVSSMCKK